MNQQTMFGSDIDPDVTIPAPHNGTATSQAAAEQIEPTAGSLRAAIYEYIRNRGSRGATRQEIERDCGIIGDTVRPRVRELIKDGLIRESGTKRETSSGRQATVLESVT